MNQAAQRRAFALIEVLLVIAAISVLSTAGYFTVVQVRETARVSKLEADVANLNNAVQMYTASGGDLAGVTTVNGVLNKLKTRADAEGVARQMGMKGSFIDPRTVGLDQSDGESGSSQSRAVWNALANKFEVKSSGAGVKAFGLDDSLSASEVEREARSRTLAASDVNSGSPVWVWDHTDVSPVASIAGQVPGQSSSTPPGDPTSNNEKMVLNAPTPYPEGGTFTIPDLQEMLKNGEANGNGDINVTFSTNNPGVSCEVMPSTSAVALAANSDAPSKVSGYFVVPTGADADVWQKSEFAPEEEYIIERLKLEVEITTNIQSPSPYQLGVPSKSGTSYTQLTFTATITNGQLYPDFQTEGFASLSVATGSSGFGGGTYSLSITQPLSISSGWDTSSGTPSLALRAMAAPAEHKTKLFEQSDDATTSVSGAKETLSVTFSPAGGDIAQSGTVTLTASGSPTNDLPQGYTIRFTTDGSDPTSSSSAYSGAGIVLGNTGTTSLKAAAFPPVAYTAWFNSPVSSATFNVPANQGGGGSIAGVMVSAISKMNGEIVGDTQLLKNNAFNWNGATDFVGDLYLPGTPRFTGNAFTNNPGSVTIVTGTGSEDPRGWEFRIDNGSITGKIHTRTDPDFAGFSDKDKAYIQFILGINPNLKTNPLTVINSGTVAPNINGNDVRTYTTSTNFGNISVGGTLRLGNPNATTYYNFDSLTINGGGQIELLGPVVLSFKNQSTLNNVLGTTTVVNGVVQPLNPEWLTIYAQAPLTINGGGGIYGKKVVSSSSVEINGFITLSEGIIANDVGVNGGGRLTVGHFD